MQPMPRPNDRGPTGAGDPPPSVICSLDQVIGDHATVSLVGELDAVGAREVLAFLYAVFDLDCVHVGVDMSGVSFVGSAGLRALTRASLEARLRDGSLALLDAGPALRRLLDVTGLDRVLPTTSTTPSPGPAGGRSLVLAAGARR